jgi:sugar phosphate isomerase/epimerase
MRLGIHMGYSSADQVAEQCLIAGVNEVFLSTASVPGFSERGHLTPEDFKLIGAQLEERDVLVPGMILPVPSREAVLGQDETERAHLCQTIRAVGQAGIDTVLFYPLDRFLYFHEYHPGRPLMVMPGEDGWSAVLSFFKEVVAVADEVNLKLASHLWAVEVLHAIWDAVPSPNNGVTYCQGMSLINEDPHSPAETWGMDRIFFAHARNQAQNGPNLMDHEEVPLSDGDVDIARCVRALMKAEYKGVLIPEHLGPQSLADAVNYLRNVIDA